MKMLLRQLEFGVYIFKGVWEGFISLHLLQESLDRMSQTYQKNGCPKVRDLGSHPSYAHSPGWETGDKRALATEFCEVASVKCCSLIRNYTKTSLCWE